MDMGIKGYPTLEGLYEWGCRAYPGKHVSVGLDVSRHGTGLQGREFTFYVAGVMCLGAESEDDLAIKVYRKWRDNFDEV